MSKTKTTTDCIVNINMEHLRMQIAQLEEENQNHRINAKKSAILQTTLECAARDLCIRILEQRCTNLDEEAQEWNDMDILKLIRIATIELDQIYMDQADEIFSGNWKPWAPGRMRNRQKNSKGRNLSRQHQ